MVRNPNQKFKNSNLNPSSNSNNLKNIDNIKTQISANNYLDLLHINKKNQHDHKGNNIKQNLNHYKKLLKLEEIKQIEENNLSGKFKKNGKLWKKKLNSFKKFKSSTNLSGEIPSNHKSNSKDISQNKHELSHKKSKIIEIIKSK